MFSPLLPLPADFQKTDQMVSIPGTPSAHGSGFATEYLVGEAGWAQGAWATFSLDPSVEGEEAYLLRITPEGVFATASTEIGLLRAAQTLHQMVENQSQIPVATIRDAPRFSWRGMHLDVGRHFMPVPDILKLLGWMARFKLNVFHWHLTEDQGWRIEIERYPDLTRLGATRQGTMRTAGTAHLDPAAHEGFYSAADVKRVVARAKELGIMVVPEIELPGHATAALAAYPDLGNNPTHRPEVGNWWGVYNTVFGVGEGVFEFLEHVLTEVAILFPGPYIHIGGDECPKEEWRASERAQAVMRTHGLRDEDELQSWFIRRVQGILHRLGKQLIGWDEILEGGLAPGALVMSWRGEEGGIAAARQGNPVVMTPWSHTYFDHYEGFWIGDEPHAIGGFTPLETVYGYEPIPKELSAQERERVLGAQGQHWREYMPTTVHVVRMAFPRMLALAEVLWGTRSPFPEFQARAMHYLNQIDADFGVERTAEIAPIQLESNQMVKLPKGRYAVRIEFEEEPTEKPVVKLGGQVLAGPIRVGGATRAFWWEAEFPEESELKLAIEPASESIQRIHGGPVRGRPAWAKYQGLPETLVLCELNSRA